MSSSSPTDFGTITTPLRSNCQETAPGLGHRAAVAREQRPDLRPGPVPVVRQALDDHRYARGGVSLVGDRFVADALELASAALDGALDRVERDGRVPGLGEHRAEGGVRRSCHRRPHGPRPLPGGSALRTAFPAPRQRRPCDAWSSPTWNGPTSPQPPSVSNSTRRPDRGTAAGRAWNASAMRRRSSEGVARTEQTSLLGGVRAAPGNSTTVRATPPVRALRIRGTSRRTAQSSLSTPTRSGEIEGPEPFRLLRRQVERGQPEPRGRFGHASRQACRPSARGAAPIFSRADIRPGGYRVTPNGCQIGERLTAVSRNPVGNSGEGRYVALERVEGKHGDRAGDRVAALYVRELVGQHGFELDPVQEQHKPTRDEHDTAVGRSGPPTWRSAPGRRGPGSPRSGSPNTANNPSATSTSRAASGALRIFGRRLAVTTVPPRRLASTLAERRPHQPRHERDGAGDRDPGDQEVDRDKAEDGQHDGDGERCHKGNLRRAAGSHERRDARLRHGVGQLRPDTALEAS